MIAVFANYFCETTFFVHTHIYQSGTVTHSHPYQQSKHHSHSYGSLEAIAMAGNYISDSVPAEEDVTVFRHVISTIDNVLTAGEIFVRIDNKPLRAPPYIL